MKNRTHTLKPQLEVLEDRRLTAILLDGAGVLYVHGTDSPEHIRVTEGYINIGTKSSPRYVPGITGTRTNTTGAVLETWSYRASRVTSLHLKGLGGSDLIRNDTTLPSTIDAGTGLDSVFGGSGKDVILGGNNVDLLVGNGGDDELHGGAGADVLRGGEGQDLLRGNGGADALFGGPGHDDLAGGAESDVLLGEAGNDLLHGNGSLDWLLGGSGHDVLDGGGGNDFLFGDTPSIETMEALSFWGDYSPTSGFPVPPDVSDDLINDTGADGSDFLFGGAGRDIMFGEGGGDELHGGDGNDLMFGGWGEDLLAGGAGSDSMDDPSILPEGSTFRRPRQLNPGGPWLVELDTYFYELGDARVRNDSGLATATFNGFVHIVSGPYHGHLKVVLGGDTGGEAIDFPF